MSAILEIARRELELDESRRTDIYDLIPHQEFAEGCAPVLAAAVVAFWPVWEILNRPGFQFGDPRDEFDLQRIMGQCAADMVEIEKRVR